MVTKINSTNNRKPFEKNIWNKVLEIEGKIPGVTGLATTFAVTTVENATPKVSGQFKKIHFNAKIKKLGINISSNVIIINQGMI